jgi:hypothetical protein
VSWEASTISALREKTGELALETQRAADTPYEDMSCRPCHSNHLRLQPRPSRAEVLLIPDRSPLFL